MISRDNRLLDDIARVAGGAAGLLASVRQQVAEEIKARMDDMVDRLDLVPRADLERVETALAALTKRLDALEGKKARAPAKKPAVKKTASKKKKK